MAYPTPTIDAVAIPLAGMAGPMRDGEDDRSTYLSGRRRTRRKGARLLQLYWEWTFQGTAAQWAVVRALLEGDADGEFEFSPRGTYAYRCRCTSELPALTPLYSTTPAGDVWHRVEVRVEAVDLVSERPPVWLPDGALDTLIDVDLDTLEDADGGSLLGFPYP